MVLNVAIETVVGAVPVLGNLFDIGWRANRRNYALLTGSIEERERHTWASWMFIGGVCVALLALMLLPMLLFRMGAGTHGDVGACAGTVGECGNLEGVGA